MMEFDSTEEGVSSIEQFYQQIEETIDFLPEQVKTSFMAAKVRQSVTQGKDEFFQNSPRAKKIKTIVNLTEDLADDDRSRIISDAVTFYLSQKKAENNVADLKPAARRACIVTDEQQKITTFDVGKNRTINGTLKIDATDEQQQIRRHQYKYKWNVDDRFQAAWIWQRYNYHQRCFGVHTFRCCRGVRLHWAWDYICEVSYR
jgi:flagellar basal body-associated protein FliL